MWNIRTIHTYCRCIMKTSCMLCFITAAYTSPYTHCTLHNLCSILMILDSNSGFDNPAYGDVPLNSEYHMLKSEHKIYTVCMVHMVYSGTSTKGHSQYRTSYKLPPYKGHFLRHQKWTSYSANNIFHL